MNFRLTAALFGVVILLLVGLLVSVLRFDPKATDPSGRVLGPLLASGVTAAEVESITLRRTEPTTEELVFTRTGTRPNVTWTQTAPATARLDQAEVNALLSALFELKATPFSGLTENLTNQGLNPPTLTVTLAGLGESLTANVGKTTLGSAAQSVTFMTTSQAPDRPFAVRRTAVAPLFRSGNGVPTDGPAGPMAKWAADYRVKRFLSDSRDPANQLTQVSISGGNKALELAKSEAGWRFVTPPGFGPADEAGDTAPQPANAPFTGVRPLILALADLSGTAEDFLPVADPGKTGLDGSATLTIRFAGQTGAEEVQLGNRVAGPDGQPVTPTKVYARLPGESGAVAVPFDRLDSLWATLDAPQSLRDRNLVAPKDRDRLDAIDLVVGGETVRLRKVAGAYGENPWVVYGGPTGPVTAKADPVDRLVELLTRPRAGQSLTTLSDTLVTGAALQATVRAWASAVPDGPKPPAGQFPPEPVVTGSPTLELALGRQESETVAARGTVGGAKADYQMPAALVNLARQPRLAWIDPKFTSFNRADAETIRYGKLGTAYEVKKSPDGWRFTEPAALAGQSADTPRILGLLDQLAGITAQTVIAEKPTSEQLLRANLDVVAPRLQVTVGLPGKTPEKVVYEFGADTEDGQAVYFRQMGAPMLTRADRRPVDLLLGSDLRDRTVYAADPAKITRVRLRGRLGQPTVQTVVVERSGTGFASPTPGLTPDPVKVADFLALLSKPRAVDYVGPGRAEYGTDVTQNAEAIEIVFDRTDGPPVSLVLGAKATGNLVYAASSAAGESFTFDPLLMRAFVGTPTGLAK